MIVQLLRIVTTGFWFNLILKKKKKKTNIYISSIIDSKNKGLGGKVLILILISYYNVRQKHTAQLLLMEKLKI